MLTAMAAAPMPSPIRLNVCVMVSSISGPLFDLGHSVLIGRPFGDEEMVDV